MRGFVINIRKAKNEDVIVTVLTSESVKNYWRFYGARHSILQIGNLIDFEVSENKNGFMPNMRSLSQHTFPWLFWNNHLHIWQNFIKLFEPHLRDTTEIENFYYELLLQSARKWDKQNPKRLAVEAYIKLLNQEKRLYKNGFCYICEEILDNHIGLMRAFIPAHPYCIHSSTLEKQEIFQLFNSTSTINLNDTTVDTLYQILLKGL
jgi:hypothetical protein